MREEKNENVEKIGFRETICMIIACYQAFFPVAISLTVGLIGAFVLVSVFL